MLLLKGFIPLDILSLRKTQFIKVSSTDVVQFICPEYFLNYFKRVFFSFFYLCSQYWWLPPSCLDGQYTSKDSSIMAKSYYLSSVVLCQGHIKARPWQNVTLDTKWSLSGCTDVIYGFSKLFINVWWILWLCYFLRWLNIWFTPTAQWLISHPTFLFIVLGSIVLIY